MDLDKLRVSVFEKTGIRLDTSDPVFALVALNEAVLAECVGRHAALLHQANDSLDQQTSRLIEAGEHYRKLLQQMAALTQSDAQPEIAAVLASETGTPAASRSALALQDWSAIRWLAAAGGVAFLSALLTLGGMALIGPRAPAAQELSKPATPAVPAIAVLTPEQIQMIQTGEKYAKILPKLDAATQAKIQRLLQQP